MAGRPLPGISALLDSSMLLSGKICCTIAVPTYAAEPGTGGLAGMLLFRPLRVSTILMLTWGVVIACPASHSQQPQKPDAPVATRAAVEQSVNVITANAPYRAISGNQRIQWAAQQTFGPQSWLTGTFTAAIGTARDSPAEYGPHCEGYAKRYGMRFSGVASSNTIEAGLGAIWGEDPRYVRDPSLPISHQLPNVHRLTFTATNRHTRLSPALQP